MKQIKIAPVAIAVTLALTAPTAATAADVVVDGSMSGTSTSVAAPPSCAPLLRQSTLTGSGSSTLGPFDYTHTVCLSGPGPITNGTFTLDFGGGNSRFGDVQGSATTTATAGLFGLSLLYDILGGSGQFDGASGTFQGTGFVDQRTAGVTAVTLDFSAVPEPGSWMTMLLGFGLIGTTLRRKSLRLKAAKASDIASAFNF